MIKLDLQNLKIDLPDNRSAISSYLDRIHAREQGFYNVIDQPVQHIKDFADSVKNKYSSIVVLGIGGSALGTICLKNSLGHLFKKREPELYVVDNIDPEFLRDLEEVIDHKTTLFIVISKSGSTTETLAHYEYFKTKVPKENFVFVTDPDSGDLREIAKIENITTFDIPANIGGRFSVLTAAALLPAALIGVDIDKLIEGAKDMRDIFLSDDYEKNICFQMAQIQYESAKKGQNINVLFTYSQKLVYLADWYKQLLAESIGKSETIGITPVSAVGVTDQHSQSQLYMDGPKDKLIIFVEVDKFDIELGVFNKLMKIEKKATADALTQKQKPNLTIQVDEVNEYTLGQFFMFFQGSVAFLGEFYGINAFDQPGVELSKILTKKYLNESS